MLETTTGTTRHMQVAHWDSSPCHCFGTTTVVVEDEMDAPEGWDSGTVTFDPYL
jgi:hypothetical protein